MHSLSFYILSLAILLLICLIGTKLSSRFGLPSLVLYLAIGVIAGTEGIGGIAFDNVRLAQQIGILALILILFSGGLETRWTSVRLVIWNGVSLATIGVLIAATTTAAFARYALGFTWPQGLLLGTTVASTDAPAVFALLRGRPNLIPEELRNTVEIESGMNDPMAVFLTTGLIAMMSQAESSPLGLLPMLLLEMGIGAIVGYAGGRFAPFLINKLRLDFDGLYPVMTMAVVMLTFGVADRLHGSGFLAVYVCGMTFANDRFFHRKSLIRFHDGLAWLMQITMFLTLGLLISPRAMIPEIGTGLLTSLVLILLARPLSVIVSLLFSRFKFAEKMVISWAGLKGATPIVLATFPLLAGVNGAERIFNAVFFIVLVSTLIQGRLITSIAKLLGVTKKATPDDLEETSIDEQSEMTELFVPFFSGMVGRSVMELGLPEHSRVLLISAEDGTFVPTGRTKLNGGDTLVVLANTQTREALVRKLQEKSGDEKGGK